MRWLPILLLWAMPVGASEQVFFHTQSSPSTTVANYICPWGGGSANDTNANRACGGMPAGIMRKLSVTVSADPANGAGVQSYAIAVLVNGVASTLTCTISEGSTSCTDEERATFAAGDRTSVSITPANTPTAVTMRMSMTFAPTTDNETAIGGSAGSTGLSNSATEYLHPNFTTDPEATENLAEFVFPMAGTLKNLYISLSGSPGTGNSYTFTVRRGTEAGAMADTAITTVVSGAETADTDLVNTISIAVGDRITLKQVPASTPTARLARYGLTFVPTVPGEFVIHYNSDDTLSASATNYVQWSTGSQAPNATETAVNQLAGHHVVLTGMYVRVDTAPGAGNSLDFYPRRNGARVGQTLQIAETATTASAFGLLIPYLFDDLVDTEIVPTSTPTVDITKISYIGTVEAVHLEGATFNASVMQ